MEKFLMEQIKKIFLGLFSFLFLLSTVWAQNYYDQHEVGWHWYDDHENEPEDKENKKVKENNLNPIMKIKAIRNTLETALDQAILNPTTQNVKNYIILQNAMSERSSRFAQVWQTVLLQDPWLDYSIFHPTNQIGREVYVDQLKQQQELAIKRLAKESGLFFFYQSTCPYCQRFSPIVKHFSEQYGISVVPITTDGIALKEFPQSRIDQGQAQQFHVTVEPALFTVNPYTHQAIPVSYGLISESDLKARILTIATAKRAAS